MGESSNDTILPVYADVDAAVSGCRYLGTAVGGRLAWLSACGRLAPRLGALYRSCWSLVRRCCAGRFRDAFDEATPFSEIQHNAMHFIKAVARFFQGESKGYF